MMKELRDVLRTVPEVEGLIGHEHAAKLMSFNEYDDDGGNEQVKSSLQSAFAKLMAASKDMVSEALSKLISRLNIESKVGFFFLDPSIYNCML
jgi:mannose-6-phosphate isomerase